jgi:ATP-dependent DNA helicase RecG
MHIIDDWGTGIQKIINGCRDHGISDPEFLEIGTSFRVNIYRDNNPLAVNGQNQVGGSNDDTGDRGGNNGTNGTNQISRELDNENKLKECISWNPTITYEGIVEATGMSRRTVNRYITALKDKGLIRRVGGTRGSWEVITNGKSGD